MRRPGFLAGVVRSKPRHGFAGGGGYVAPAPAPPPASKFLPISGGTTLNYAVDNSTGNFYLQDTRCPAGERMANVPCTGDCDPGEMENECSDDPNYKELPNAPQGGFKSCSEWSSAGYPSGQCNQNTCPSCFAPQPTHTSHSGGGGGGGGGYRPPAPAQPPPSYDDPRYASQQALFQPGPAAAGPAIPRIAIIGGAVLIGAIVLIKLIK